MVKPQFELGRERVGRGVVRDAGDRREAILLVAEAARELGLPVRGFASSGLPGPKGNRETFVWCGGEGARGRGPRGGDRRRRGGRASEDRGADHPLAPAGGDRGGRDRRRRRPRGRLAPGRHRARSCDKHGAAADGHRGRRPTPTSPTSAWCSAATARSCTRCAASPTPASRSSASTSAPSASSPRSTAAKPRPGSAAPSPARSRRSSCPASRSRSAARGCSASTTSPSPAARTTGSPSSATGSPARRSATSAATASSPPPRPARPATTSPTRGRSSPGA